MHVQVGRTDRTRPSSSAEGVTGLLAALGFAFAVVWPSVGPQLHLLQPSVYEPPARAALRAARDPALPAPDTGARADPAEDTPSARPAFSSNTIPVIQSVSVYGGGPVTAASDLRLDVAATDPDGDRLQLTTHWTINGRALETTRPILPRSEIRRGDRVTARVVAWDGLAASEAFTTSAIAIGNASPTIVTFPSGFDASGAFVYPITAVDPDGDADLEIRLVEAPAGMFLDARDATLRWSPDASQAGLHAVRLEVHDGRGGASDQAFDLRVGRGHPTPSSLADSAAP